MSAYLVEDKTISRIVYWLSCELARMPYLQVRMKTMIGVNAESEGWQQELARDMFQLNIAGVEARYGQQAETHMTKEDFHYCVYEPSIMDMQAYKSLQCWLYQCSEGDVPNNILYKFFDEVIASYLAQKIIVRLPAYEKAEWK